MNRKYEFFTTKEIKPYGWTKKQLQLQAEGLAGNLDKVWPDVRDSQWIGGDKEGWERVPYWLDGFIPLAYLLDNDDMKARAQRYVDVIMANQKEDGWICPNGDTPIDKYDTWAVLLLTKVLTVYYDCSGDERALTTIYRTLKNYYELLKEGKIKLFDWGKYRWYEGFIALQRIYDKHPGEEWIKELAKILKEQGKDYCEVIEQWKVPLNKWTYDTHVVNLAMMIKSEAVSCDLLGEEYVGLADRLYDELYKYNGTSVGIITGDECLSGLSSIQGSELCSVVEMMYSFEHLYAVTGNTKWAELLELVGFNALPASITDDMWGHQYDQMANQIDCTPFPVKPIFRTNNTEAHVFGLEPHFGCCTANFGQGWPKFVLASFMKAPDGILSTVPMPSLINTEWEGTPVSVLCDTEYPFRNKFTYTVNVEKDTQMKLKIRIPSFAKKIKVNDIPINKRPYLVIDGFKAGETVIEFSYETTPELISRHHRLYSAKCGSLVFSLPVEATITPVEYVRDGIERKLPYCDYHYKGSNDWNYAYASKELKLIEVEGDDIPFSQNHPKLVLEADMCHIDWGYEDGYETLCAKIPMNKTPLDRARKVKLYPYGCAKLRMTDMPVVKIK